MKCFSREEILGRLRKKTERGEKVVVCTAAAGIVGKAAEEAGADLLMCLYSAVYDADGIGCGTESISYLDANAAAREATVKVLSAVKHTPVITGIGMTDPYRDIKDYIKQLIKIKCSGIANYPSVGMLSPDVRRAAEESGSGVEKEAEMLSWCREQGVFTMAYVYQEEDAAIFSDADVVIADSGYREEEDAVECIVRLAERIRKDKPEAVVLFGGHAFDKMDVVKQCIRRADVQGFVGRRMTSLAPIETAVRELTGRLKQMEIR